MERKKNRSRTYLAPLVLSGLTVNKKAVVNSYVYNVHDINFNDKEIGGLFIEVSYKYESVNTFKFNNRCLYFAEIDDETFLVFIKADPYFLNDIKLILESKYSQISDDAKRTIYNFWSVTSDNIIYQVLTKHETYRRKLEETLNEKISEQAELGEYFTLKNEVFEKDILIKDSIDNE